MEWVVTWSTRRLACSSRSCATSLSLLRRTGHTRVRGRAAAAAVEQQRFGGHGHDALHYSDAGTAHRCSGHVRELAAWYGPSGTAAKCFILARKGIKLPSQRLLTAAAICT